MSAPVRKRRERPIEAWPCVPVPGTGGVIRARTKRAAQEAVRELLRRRAKAGLSDGIARGASMPSTDAATLAASRRRAGQASRVRAGKA